MAKVKCQIGFLEEQVESAPGVYTNVITERSYKVNVIKVTAKQQEGEHLNRDISLLNTFSIIADAYLQNTLFAMKYIKWMGVRWTISDIDPSTHPRITFRVGVVYNGPTPAP